MKTLHRLFLLALLSVFGGSATFALTVLPTDPAFGLYDLGSFGPGSYSITGSGIVGLTPGNDFLMRPDGTPDTAVTSPAYLYFNPDGSFLADGLFGPGGANVKIGALMGTLTNNPVSASDWFQIGYSKLVVLGSTSHIYLAVNDTYYPNDSGSFTAEIRAVETSVPDADSTTLGLLAGALTLLGVIRRPRR